MRRPSLRRLVAAVALTAATATLAACAGGTNTTAGGGGAADKLTLAVSLDSGAWEPALLQNGHQAQYWNAVYDTLLHMEPDTTVVPGMAETFEYNDDNTVLTLGLREGITFSDGTPFDAEAVKANIENLRDGAGQNSVMVSSVDEVVAVDELTAELRLTQPDPALLTYLTLAGGVMGSPAALGTDEITTQPVGSGPYVLDAGASEPGVRFVFTRNPDYWDATAYPYETLELVVINELTARVNALRSGQVQGITADGTAVAEAESAGLGVSEWPLNRRGLYLADRDGTVVPALADKRVRQAINHAIDAQGILDGIQLGYGERSTQVFNPTSVNYVPALNDAYPFDPDRARALLAEAGYADGFDVLMPESAEEKSNPIVAQQLADVGIRVQYEKVAPTSYVEEVQSGRYGMFWFSNSTAEAWWDMSKQIPAAAPWNPFSTATPELDALIEQARTAPDEDTYAQSMTAINEYVVDEAWFDIWYLENVVYLSAPEVEVTVHPMNVVPFIKDFAPAPAS
ncbi:ABC transporter substrate-binding protein [Pseudonocardia nematodicida]|uniref:ABC transporter substrate-binding protein n=1 Tax=Pseudonocardia nematodicida TaxID=1206997 RepID=A0ABV1KHY4_9PSEU